MSECGFCGQDHGPPRQVGPFPVVPCPNLPEDWTLMGYPGEDQTIIRIG